MTDVTRRAWIAAATAVTVARAADASKDKPFGLMFNTATIMGQKLDAAKQVDVAADAGYDAIEPWVRDLEAHGKPKELAKRIKDRGLTVESAIGFAPWIVADE